MSTASSSSLHSTTNPDTKYGSYHRTLHHSKEGVEYLQSVYDDIKSQYSKDIHDLENCATLLMDLMRCSSCKTAGKFSCDHSNVFTELFNLMKEAKKIGFDKAAWIRELGKAALPIPIDYLKPDIELIAEDGQDAWTAYKSAHSGEILNQ